MKHVRVQITAHGQEADIHPMYDIWANAPFIERSNALQWNYTGEALGILHHAVGDADAFETAIEDVPEVLDYDIVRAGEDAFYAYIRDATTDTLDELFGPITNGGVIVIPPIRYHEDGTVTLTLFGPDAEIQHTLERMRQLIEVAIEEISGLSATAAAVETRLSRRQREALEAAVELGYYEIPREASHEDIATVIECAPSTAAEHLRKAESTVISSLFGR